MLLEIASYVYQFLSEKPVVIGSDLKLGPTVVVTVLLLYKYVFHSYIGTFAVCGWYVCNAGCICS